VTELAASDTIADRRLHPATMALRWLAEAPQTIIGLPALFAFMSDMGIGRALLVMLGVALITLVLAGLRWHRFRYGVGEHELVIETGLIGRNRRLIPFSRVQDVDIERKLLHRVFGLARVNVESGSGGKDEGSLDSVSIEEAGRIRAAVRAAKGQAQAVATGVAPVLRDDVVYTMSLVDVLRFGAFSFSFSSLAAILGGTWYLMSQFEDAFADPDDIYKRAKGYAPDHFEWSWLFWALAILLLLALVTSVGKTLLTHYGYRLTRQERGFRRERGLLTRTEAMIPERRIQAALIATNPVWRRAGKFGLSFQTMGGGDGLGGEQAALPFADAAAVNALLSEVEPLLLPDETRFRPVSARHAPLEWITNAGFLAAIALAVSYFFPIALFSLVPVALVATLTWAAARRHRYFVEGDLVAIRSGLLRQRLWIVPVAKLQSLRISQGPIQRRLGLASLHIDTAGASAFATNKISNLDVTVAPVVAELLSTLAWGKARA
jgi:putative membrane protein